MDLSTSTGLSILDSGAEKPVLVAFGAIKLPVPICAYGEYPWSYLNASRTMASCIATWICHNSGVGMEGFAPIDLVVIEETNLGKNRYAQKALEFIHSAVLVQLELAFKDRVIYLSSSEWRHNLGLTLSKDDKKNNAQISKAKTLAKTTGITIYEAKAQAGLKGKINKKHIAIRYVNEYFGLSLKMKDDDVADSICLALAALNKATPCDGV